MTAISVHPDPPRLTSAQEASVGSELNAILNSPHFVGSKRCQDLLEFVVESALRRDFESLTERFIGAKVFGRPIEYETATDAIVRVRANDVRRRLAQYYSEQSKSSPVRIELNIGSYIPEFRFSEVKIAESNRGESDVQSEKSAGNLVFAGPVPVRKPEGWWRSKRLLGVAIAAGVMLAGLITVAVVRWVEPHPVQTFWAPILRNRGAILLCAGGNTFLQNPVPGFFVAGKEIDYPYFSLQTEISTTLLSALIERNGAIPQFRFAASTPLPELQEHPIILLNAYNNQWTLRLTDPLRFHFSPMEKSPQSIVDRQHPGVAWYRDSSLSYENSDDYALLARFWDGTTDNWVIVLAGLGRNGTEAATRFVVDPHYMGELRDRLGRGFRDQNIEVVLRVSVVDGKTGAPQIVAATAW